MSLKGNEHCTKEQIARREGNVSPDVSMPGCDSDNQMLKMKSWDAASINELWPGKTWVPQ